MPRNVRPSYLKAHVDGRKSPVSTGPMARNGSMSLSVFVRNHGSVSQFVSLDLVASEDGSTVSAYMTIRLPDGTQETITAEWTQ